MKVLLWDLETTRLEANLGFILTASAKWLNNDKMMTWRIDDGKGYGRTPKSLINDKWIVRELTSLIDDADMLVHHYGDGFDLPFLRTRALYWGLSPANQIRTVDTWKVASRNLRMASNKLVALCDFLNGEDGQKDTSLSFNKWQLASHGDKSTISKILEYNIQDVYALEELYLNLRPVIHNHPYIARPDGTDRRLQCHVCGSSNTVSQGSYYTKLYSVKRRRCKECGSPFEEGRSKIK
jgi:uncharacterized protein YprB with RNaseH-like and TPR domain